MNFQNLTRYSPFVERIFSDHFQQPFDFKTFKDLAQKKLDNSLKRLKNEGFHKICCLSYLIRAPNQFFMEELSFSDYLLFVAIDPYFVSKSDKLTFEILLIFRLLCSITYKIVILFFEVVNV